MKKKKRRAKLRWDKKAFFFSVLLALFFVAICVYTIMDPYYTDLRLFRFFIYSISLMFPVLVLTLSNLLLKSIGISIFISDTMFFVLAYFLYFILIYPIALAYLSRRNKKEKKMFWIKTGIWVGIFLLFSIGYLIKSFYF